MNLDELRSAQAKERRKDSLQHLRDSFYDDVGAYVADLRAARDRRAEQVENPFADDDVRRLSDEVETAEEVAEALYERRVGKVVKLASFAAADMPVEEEGMTTEERRLFDDLVERITTNKSDVLDVLAGESANADESVVGAEAIGADARTEAESTESAPRAESEPAPETESGPGALADAMGDDEPSAAASEGPRVDEATATEPTGNAGGSAEPDGDGSTAVPPEPAPRGAVGVDDSTDESAPDDVTTGDSTGDASGVESPPSEADADPDPVAGERTDGGRAGATETEAERTTVRITRDVGAIFGVDEREYELTSEDVVSLPAENAEPLVQRDAAERID